jgi:hypothetical protein
VLRAEFLDSGLCASPGGLESGVGTRSGPGLAAPGPAPDLVPGPQFARPWNTPAPVVPGTRSAPDPAPDTARLVLG